MLSLIMVDRDVAPVALLHQIFSYYPLWGMPHYQYTATRGTLLYSNWGDSLVTNNTGI